MAEVLSGVGPGELIGLVAVAGGLLIPILCGVMAIVMDGLHKMREVALKQDMVNRGMSADEIRTVIEAGSKHSRKEARSRHFCCEK
jgi:hypothetical protein